MGAGGLIIIIIIIIIIDTEVNSKDDENGVKDLSSKIGGLASNLKDNTTSLIGKVFMPISNTIKNKILPATLGYVDELQEAFNKDGITEITSSIALVDFYW